MYTASQIQDRLVTTLVRSSGGSPRRWRIALGPVQLRDPAKHPHCNWTVVPTGTAREVAEIEKLLDRFRLAHPRASPD